MHANIFDRYLAGQSLIHRLDPRLKVVVTLLFIISNVLLPDGAWLAFSFSLILILLIAWISGIGMGYTLKRSFVALPFFLAAITAIFALPGRTLAVWNLGPWHLVATDVGLLRFISIVIRSWLSVQVAIVLVATTQFPDLMHALRHLHVPAVLIAVISFMYRYLFVMTNEAMRLMRAREARSARPLNGGGGGSIAWRAKVAGNMAGQLFLRSYERSERVYNAMLSRGYQGQLLTLNPHTLQTRDWLLGLGMLIILAGLQVVGRIWVVNLF
jgi:cobalt/nickel transport system permease protein